MIVCTPKELPLSEQVAAARQAMTINPVNRPPLELLTTCFAGDFVPSPEYLAVVTSRYWGQGGVDLTVGFLESIQADLRDRILAHMNAWSEFANVKFRWTQTSPQVRITRSQEGYWSYLGTDVLRIRKNEPTMCLQGFTMNTSEAEFRRVVRHETGHTLGFPHEHLRRELVAKLDVQKTIAYFQRTQGWSPQMVRQQVLTPLEESSLLGTDHADDDSIMCYQLPGSITTDGQPIAGGNDIDDEDKAFAAKVYPKPGTPPTPPPTGDHRVIRVPAGTSIEVDGTKV